MGRKLQKFRRRILGTTHQACMHKLKWYVHLSVCHIRNVHPSKDARPRTFYQHTEHARAHARRANAQNAKRNNRLLLVTN
jgi:hypothetical protein